MANSVPRISGRLTPAAGDSDYLWLLAALIGPVPLFLFGLEALVHNWSRPGHILYASIPAIAGVTFLKVLSRLPSAKDVRATRWPGIAGAVLSLSLAIVGNFAWLDDLVILAMIIWLSSLAVLWFGVRRAASFWAPVAMLGLILPIPKIIANPALFEIGNLALLPGSGLSRLLGAEPKTLENVLADGHHRAIEFSQATPSLTEIIMVLVLTLLFAGFSRSPLFTRILPVLLALPVVIVMAGLRIGLLSYVGQGWGTSEAERFLQLFQGWPFIGLSALVSIAGAQGALELLKPRASTRAADSPMADRGGQSHLVPSRRGRRQRTLAATALLACGVSSGFLLMPERAAPDVPRDSLRLFPPELGGWSGSVSALRPSTEWILRADDYLNATFLHSDQTAPVSLWIAYYREQKGYDIGTVHLPEVCLPNDGWTIVSKDKVRFSAGPEAAHDFKLNRAVISRGEATALVYYWLEGRGRRQTDEIWARLMVKYDILARGRSDRAIVRLVTPVLPGEPEAAADARLQSLLRTILPQLPRFIPE